MDETWAVWFDGVDDEPAGVCVNDNQTLIFVGEMAEVQAREALELLMTGGYGWKPADRERYRAVAVNFNVQPMSP